MVPAPANSDGVGVEDPPNRAGIKRFFSMNVKISEKSQELIMVFRGCQIGMQGSQLCAKPSHFCKLDVAASRITYIDLNLHVLQVAASNSNN